MPAVKPSHLGVEKAVRGVPLIGLLLTLCLRNRMGLPIISTQKKGRASGAATRLNVRERRELRTLRVAFDMVDHRIDARSGASRALCGQRIGFLGVTE